MDPKKIFLFNSCLPTSGATTEDSLNQLGPSLNNFRGRNIGNGYISYSILKILFGKAVKVSHIPNAWEHNLTPELANNINKNFSHLIFVMQDFIREHFAVLPFDKITNFLEMINIPIVPISLGANSFNGYDITLKERLTEDQITFLKVISEKSQSIGVRGRYTAEILNSLGIKNVKIVGCPSFFESGPSRSIQKNKWDKHKVITTGMFFNQNLNDSIHLLQDEMYLIDSLYLNQKLAKKAFKSQEELPFNEHDLSTSLHLLNKAYMNRLEFFLDFEKWIDFFKGREICLSIGSRLHSSIFSINRGVPAIVTNSDSRAKETCEFLNIEHNPSLNYESDLEEVFEKLDLSKMNNSYERLYENFISYLRDHGLFVESKSSSHENFEFTQPIKQEEDKIREIISKDISEVAEKFKLLQNEVYQCRVFQDCRSVRIIRKLQNILNKNPRLHETLKLTRRILK